MPQLFVLPSQVPLSIAGAPMAACTLTFSATGTSTAQNIYSDIDLTIPLSNPLSADSAGAFPKFYLDPSLPNYRVILKTSAGVVLETWDDVPSGAIDSEAISLTLDSLKRTAAEIAASITPTNYAYPPLVITRYALDWAQWQSVAASATSAGWYNYFSRRGPTSTALGEAALITETVSGNANSAFGYQALKANTDGAQNSAFGKGVLSANTVGSDNTGGGFNCLLANTSGEKNTGFGSFNLSANTTGSFNAAFGQNCLTANTTGSQNNAHGQGALFNNTTGSYNSAYGEHALLSNIAADDNSAFGAYALEDNTTGVNNCGFGRNALQNNTTGHENAGFGKDCLQNVTTGSENTAGGHGALNAITTVSGLTAFGKSALVTNTTGVANAAFGRRSLQNNATGQGCSAFGEDALVASTADFNTAGGKNAGLGNTSGAGNTYLGHSAGATNTSGGTNTFIGYTADANAGNYNNTTAIGNAATCTNSNQVTLGNSSVSVLRCQVTTITALSDARFKKNIRKLEIPDEALNEIEIVVYEWIDEGMPQGLQVGIIAQQLDAWQTKWDLEWLKLVDKSDPERWEATPGKLLFLLIPAFQRLSARVAALETR